MFLLFFVVLRVLNNVSSANIWKSTYGIYDKLWNTQQVCFRKGNRKKNSSIFWIKKSIINHKDDSILSVAHDLVCCIYFVSNSEQRTSCLQDKKFRFRSLPICFSVFTFTFSLAIIHVIYAHSNWEIKLFMALSDRPAGVFSDIYLY